MVSLSPKLCLRRTHTTVSGVHKGHAPPPLHNTMLQRMKAAFTALRHPQCTRRDILPPPTPLVWLLHPLANASPLCAFRPSVATLPCQCTPCAPVQPSHLMHTCIKPPPINHSPPTSPISTLRECVRGPVSDPVQPHAQREDDPTHKHTHTHTFNRNPGFSPMQAVETVHGKTKNAVGGFSRVLQGYRSEKCKSCTKKPYSRVIFFFAVNACNFFFAVSRVNYKKKLNFLIFAVSRVIFFFCCKSCKL